MRAQTYSDESTKVVGQSSEILGREHEDPPMRAQTSSDETTKVVRRGHEDPRMRAVGFAFGVSGHLFSLKVLI